MKWVPNFIISGTEIKNKLSIAMTTTVVVIELSHVHTGHPYCVGAQHEYSLLAPGQVHLHFDVA